ncbi:MAG: HEAT repeat domain-containing protein [Planctomycetota bacterium]|jgi:HEAT repeat protein
MHSKALHFLLFCALAVIPACGGGSQEAEPEKTSKSEKKKKSKKASRKTEKAPGEPEKKEVPPEVLEALGSEDPEARSDAIGKVREFGADAVPALLGLLEKGNPEARSAALLCIGLAGDPSAKKGVETFLEKAKTLEEKLYGLMALGEVGDASSVAVVKGFIGYTAPVRFEKKAGFMVKKGRETEEGLVRNQAAESLARLGDYTGIPALIENLDGNGWVRKDALIRLRRMTDCKVDHGYNYNAGRPARAKAIAAWRVWWRKNQDGFKPAWTDAFEVFDLNKRGN